MPNNLKSILLTNDDGIEAEGLKTLRDELRRIANVIVVAPNRERSAVSHGRTFHSPLLKLEEIEQDCFSLNGLPADCVFYALDELFIKPPDMVISGINHGSNLGDDVMYSGTVAAAREAARFGIPSIAVSQKYEDGKKIQFKDGVAFTRNMVRAILENGIGGELLLNVNIPMMKIKGAKFTRQGYTENPRHFPISKDAWNLQSSNDELIRDIDAVNDGYVSITPLQRDQTDYHAAQALVEIGENFFLKQSKNR